MFIGLRFSFGRTSITEINVDQQSNLATKTTIKFIHSILLAFKCSYIHYGRMISMFFLLFFLPSSSSSPLVLLLPLHSNYITFFMGICLWYNVQLNFQLQDKLFCCGSERGEYWNFFQIRCHIQAKQRQQEWNIKYWNADFDWVWWSCNHIP